MINEEKSFKLDPFQEEAINYLKEGHSVIVSAPTGSGKTAIAEFTIEEALKGKERVFYTTPLKALSNQKFHDFRKKYGEEKVGILTGDSAINRDGQIVVMTTEIYRNMLYGTKLGSVDENLKELRYLVLDECHYMNDPDRGTVWEESIIYSPETIQILALSATVANASELTDWINKIHGDTKLVESNFRPVPLKFYYYRNNSLVPLLTTDDKLNPNLKNHKDAFNSGKLKFKDKMRLKNHIPQVRITDMVIELSKKGFLPGIYFVFSRRGCETALSECQGLGFSLLTPSEKVELSSLIQEKTFGNEYLSKHKHLEMLYQGMAAHHAGLLPQWKSLVEELFSKGLIKIVFATETLAAGINMPAKTTIISNLSKRGDSGHQNLTSNQFLQMSGRAGRRGMDKLGNVVIKETNEHAPIFAAKLATNKPDPLVSRFSPNYSMALNLLQNHRLEDIKDLLHKSFGQYLIIKDLASYVKDEKELSQKITGLGKYPCPDPKNPGDIKIFRKQEEKINELKRNLDILEEQNGLDVTNFQDDFKKAKLENINFPCYSCKHKTNCFAQEKDFRKTSKRLDIAKKIIEDKDSFYWNRFLNIEQVLTKLGYLENRIPNQKGILATSVRGENILLIAEIILKVNFSKLRPEEFAGVISSLAIDGVRPKTFSRARPSHNIDDVIVQMSRIVRDVVRIQRDHQVDIKTQITPLLCGLVEEWARPGTKWEDLFRLANLDEGDIIRIMRRTMDLLRHIKNAPYLNPKLNELAEYAYDLMDKSPVKEEL